MMRRRIILVVLLVLFAGFGAFAFIRSGTGSAGPEGPDGGAEAADAVAGPSGPNAGGSVAAPDGGLGGDAEDPSKLARTLRVVSPDIELLAPGIVANDGMDSGDGETYADSDLKVAFDVTDGMEDVRRALARGGGKSDGADIAVVPLPSFVASYEQLRALKPEVFFVTGRSKGREALATRREDALVDPPDGDSIELRGRSGESATFLGLYAMDLADIPLEEVTVEEEAGDETVFAAVGRSRPDFGEAPEGHDLLVSTADAIGLVPYVAIAPHGFVERHPEALYQWADGWLGGQEQIEKDVPESARMVAGDTDDADELALIDLLGWIEFATPLDNARMAGLSGRRAATLERLFRLTWRVWRAAGELTTPVPEAFPVTTETIMEVVRTEVDNGGSAGVSAAEEGEGSEEPEGDVLVVYRYVDDDLDEDAFVEQVGLLADIFRRSPLRVTVNWNRPRTDDMIETSRKRFDIPERRLYGGRSTPGRGTASVEIFEVR